MVMQMHFHDIARTLHEQKMECEHQREAQSSQIVPPIAREMQIEIVHNDIEVAEHNEYAENKECGAHGALWG